MLYFKLDFHVKLYGRLFLQFNNNTYVCLFVSILFYSIVETGFHTFQIFNVKRQPAN